MNFSIGSGGVSTQNILRVDGVGGCELDIGHQVGPSKLGKKYLIFKKFDYFLTSNLLLKHTYIFI
jgi:hypothetical protein